MKGVKMESDTETMVEQKKINPENNLNRIAEISLEVISEFIEFMSPFIQ